MGRRLAITTVLISLCVVGTAGATRVVTGSPNRYAATVAVTGGAGSRQRPVAVAVSQTLDVVNVRAADVPAPLLEVSSRIYGLRIPFARRFPVCTPAMIVADHGNGGRWNGVCPKRSLVASGRVYAALTSPATGLAGPGIPCHLRLWGYNDGPGRLTFFLTAPPLLCHGLATGDAAPWEATYRQAGRYLISEVRAPADVSYDAGRVGLFGSVDRESLDFRRTSISAGGRLYPFIESTGCPGHGRAYAITFTSTSSATGSPASSPATLRGRMGCG